MVRSYQRRHPKDSWERFQSEPIASGQAFEHTLGRGNVRWVITRVGPLYAHYEVRSNHDERIIETGKMLKARFHSRDFMRVSDETERIAGMKGSMTTLQAFKTTQLTDE